MALPYTAHTRGRDRQSSPLKLVGYPYLAPGRLFQCELNHRIFHLRGHAVYQVRLAPCELLQRKLPAHVVELFEAIEAIATVAHNLARLAHVAELLGKLQ